MMEKVKELIAVETLEPVYYLNENVTYSQVDSWFGHVTRDLKMDIIYPQNSGNCYPCIVWICGGGWREMDKGAHLPYLADLARRGFVVASVEYRLSNEAIFPAALKDIKAAIRYLRAHARRYAIDSDYFGVMGESAGGYLAAMTALTGNRPEFEAGEHLALSSSVQAACPWYMPCDVAQMPPDVWEHITFFGGDPKTDKQLMKATSPLEYITAQTPPFLLLHGTDDTLVPFVHSEILFEALWTQNIDTKLVGFKGTGHADLQFFQRATWDIIAEFFKDKLARRKG